MLKNKFTFLYIYSRNFIFGHSFSAVEFGNNYVFIV